MWVVYADASVQRSLSAPQDVAVVLGSHANEVLMPYRFTFTTTIPAPPDEIYRTWLDSRGHSEMTGGEAAMSDQIGAEISAWGSYITGRNLELVPGERIVQSWRTSEFGDERQDSIITVVLTEAGDGTLLTLEHSNVPDDHRSYEEGGWQSNYFEPMVAYFTKRKRGAASTRSAKSPGKTKRGAGANSKRATPRAKASRAKSKRKSKGKTRHRGAAARQRPKRLKRKSSRGKG
jgi:uncharacterized protein YndB with AHSA1/START domain